MNNPDPITIIVLMFVSFIIIMAVVQGGASTAPAKKPRKTTVRKPNGNKVNVNVNGRHVRTITIKEHTRKVAY